MSASGSQLSVSEEGTEERNDSTNNTDAKEDEVQQSDEGKLEYAIHLWEGTRAAYNQYGASKKLLNDMAVVLGARATAEERYAKELMTLSSRENKVDELEPSSVNSAWHIIRSSNKEMSEVHQAISGTMHQMIKQLQGQIKSEATQKKRILAEDKELHAQLSKLKNSTEVAKKKYMSAAEAEELQTRKIEGATAAGMQAKKLKQMETHLHKLTSDRDKSHQSYKTTLASLHEMQKNFEESMKGLLNDLQQMEQNRLKSIQDFMISVADCDQIVTDKRASQLQAITESDIQSFIERNKTGQVPEELVEEVHYVEHLEPVEIEVKKRKGTTLRSKKRDPDSKSTKTVASIAIPKGEPRGVSKSHGATNVDDTSPITKSPKEHKEKTTLGKLLSPRNRAKKEATKQAASTSRRKARALYDFNPTEEGELGFKVGDIVTILRVDDAGWWDAEMNGVQGIIPGNRVEIMEEAIGGGDVVVEQQQESAAPAPQVEEGVVEKTTVPSVVAPQSDAVTVDPEVVESGESVNSEVSRSAADDDSEEDAAPIGTVTAMYNFPGDGDDELPMKVGETITIYQQVEEWYTGTNTNGDYGLLPMNFCSDLVPFTETEAEEI